MITDNERLQSLNLSSIIYYLSDNTYLNYSLLFQFGVNFIVINCTSKTLPLCRKFAAAGPLSPLDGVPLSVALIEAARLRGIRR